MKIDQIAYYATTKDHVQEIKETFGLQNAKWIEDNVTGIISCYGGPKQTSKGKLLFNYDLGIELEILQYEQGSLHWHALQSDWPYKTQRISHIGIHLDDGEDFPDLQEPWILAQELWTTRHTNEYVVSKGRTYHYKIFQNLNSPNFLKYIKRINPKQEVK